MYTRCPHCLTVFLVAAEQLKAAHGNVRCGTCLESFDAIPHLSDGPAQEDSEVPAEFEVLDLDVDPDQDRGPGGNDDGGDDRIASEQLSSTLDAARQVASLDDDGFGAPAGIMNFDSSGSADAGDDAPGDDVPGDDVPSDDVPGHDAPGDEDAGARHEPVDGSPATAAGLASDGTRGTGGTGAHVAVLPESAHDVREPLPDVLREDAEKFVARSAARRRNIGYGVAALALLMLLAAQYVFFMPEDAARRYPQWRGAIESMCAQVGCVLPERRDPARIRVLSRDVRVHPRYEGVMQIKATLTNSAAYRQPYPRMRFTLFNVNGQTIASRVFQPSEYLGRPVAASARLRSRTPFQVEFDVLVPEEAAVSFEFSFL